MSKHSSISHFSLTMSDTDSEDCSAFLRYARVSASAISSEMHPQNFEQRAGRSVVPVAAPKRTPVDSSMQAPRRPGRSRAAPVSLAPSTMPSRRLHRAAAPCDDGAALAGSARSLKRRYVLVETEGKSHSRKIVEASDAASCKRMRTVYGWLHASNMRRQKAILCFAQSDDRPNMSLTPSRCCYMRRLCSDPFGFHICRSRWSS